MNDFTCTKTHRGFSLFNFKDDNGADCSIQKSSSAEDDKIWLGCDTGLHHLGECMARMHLTKNLAKEIVTILNRFIETGDIHE